LAAHFVNWVEKNDDIRGMFERFARLYNDADEVVQRVPDLASGPGLKTPVGDTSPVAEKTSEKTEEAVCPPNILSGSVVPTEEIRPKLGAAPGKFSAACRKHLLDGMGIRSQSFVEMATRLRFPAGGFAQEAERQEGAQLPNPADFRATAETVANPTLQGLLADRYTDWATAGFMLHYERLLAGADANGNVEVAGAQEVGDPTRLEVRRTATAMNKAIKAFASADLRARREQHNEALRQRLDRLVQKPEGDGEPEPVLPEEAKPTSPAAATITPAMQVASHVEGL